MAKLRLKRTPEERARRRAARRRRPDGPEANDGPASHKSDPGTIRAELEEMRFKEKMWEALEEDERLDGINSRFNDYAHIPDRWTRDRHDAANPQYMDDDEYAEWVREGMWKKKHAREYAEQAKRDAEKAARRTREKETRAETSRLRRLALEQGERRRKEMRKQQEEKYRQRYEQSWKALLDNRTRDRGTLAFQDIPWPLFPAHFAEWNVSDSHSPRVEEIAPEAIAAFLLPDMDDTPTLAENDGISGLNRDRLKETLLRFHPDKFEGRLMHRVLASDTERVREAVGQVARALNLLMSGKL